MARHLFGTIRRTIAALSILDLGEQTSVKFKAKVSSTLVEYNWICRLQNVGHVVMALLPSHESMRAILDVD